MTDDEDQRRIGALCLELERVERERDEAIALLRDMKPHWDANTRGRVWDATTAGFMASIRARIDALLEKHK